MCFKFGKESTAVISDVTARPDDVALPARHGEDVLKLWVVEPTVPCLPAFSERPIFDSVKVTRFDVLTRQFRFYTAVDQRTPSVRCDYVDVAQDEPTPDWEVLRVDLSDLTVKPAAVVDEITYPKRCKLSRKELETFSYTPTVQVLLGDTSFDVAVPQREIEECRDIFHVVSLIGCFVLRTKQRRRRSLTDLRQLRL